MKGNQRCKNINIVGDGITGIFDTPWISHISGVFQTAYTLNSLINIMNFKFQQYGIKQINVGIGVDYGRALMIKAGYNGSGINDIVWMGDVVNYATTLSSFGCKTWNDQRIMVSDTFYANLDEVNQRLMTRNYQRQCYHGDVVSIGMNQWLQQEVVKSQQNNSLSL
jgi:class 3 adenylate cyclase